MILRGPDVELRYFSVSKLILISLVMIRLVITSFLDLGMSNEDIANPQIKCSCTEKKLRGNLAHFKARNSNQSPGPEVSIIQYE